MIYGGLIEIKATISQFLASIKLYEYGDVNITSIGRTIITGHKL